jgi:hypothetical protein
MKPFLSNEQRSHFLVDVFQLLLSDSFRVQLLKYAFLNKKLIYFVLFSVIKDVFSLKNLFKVVGDRCEIKRFETKGWQVVAICSLFCFSPGFKIG